MSHEHGFLHYADEKNAIAQNLGFKDFFEALPVLYREKGSAKKAGAVFGITSNAAAYQLHRLKEQVNGRGATKGTIRKLAEKNRIAHDLGYENYNHAIAQLYFVKIWSLPMIGKAFGVSSVTVGNQLKKDGFQLRSPGGNFGRNLKK